MDETRYEALGRFLRLHREALSPESAAVSSRRPRRTPGLRREEVAFLAGIGVKWYARMEAGDDINPSIAALTRIAGALRLTAAEYEYILELARLRPSKPSKAEVPGPVSFLLDAFVRNLRGVAVVVADRTLTPLRWNALADAMHGHSCFEDPVERNALVRGLFDPELIAFLGNDREVAIRNAVGMLRLDLSSETPSPFGGAVYERIKKHQLFQRMWEQRVVATQTTNEHYIVRHHARVGKLSMYAIDLGATTGGDWYLRTLMPADKETEEKFALLEATGYQQVLPAKEGDYSA